MEEKHCVYILQSLKDGKLYTGCTNNLDRRFREHNGGKVKSTKNRRPLKIVCVKRFRNGCDALTYERYLKSPEGGPSKKLLIEQYDSSFKNE
jgi:putative endonuclease